MFIIAHLSDFLAGGDDLIQAEFIIEDNAVVKMRLHLETELGELIWFESVRHKGFSLRTWS